MLKKIKSVLAVVGGVLLAVLGYLFVSKKRPQTGAKDELKEAQKKVEEAKEKVARLEQAIKDAQSKTDEEVKHAKEVEVPTEPNAVADAFNDLLDRIRGSESRGAEQQNCDGCNGRN
jgi:peptidoglycan hydrolase CwlO-like protein